MVKRRHWNLPVLCAGRSEGKKIERVGSFVAIPLTSIFALRFYEKTFLAGTFDASNGLEVLPKVVGRALVLLNWSVVFVICQNFASKVQHFGLSLKQAGEVGEGS
jgi:hypothetical protein